MVVARNLHLPLDQRYYFVCLKITNVPTDCMRNINSIKCRSFEIILDKLNAGGICAGENHRQN